MARRQIQKRGSNSQRKAARGRAAATGSTRSARNSAKQGKPAATALVQEAKPPIGSTELACWGALLLAAAAALFWKHRSVYFLSWTDEPRPGFSFRTRTSDRTR